MQFRKVWTICRVELFFDGNGMPKLMNRKMYQICQNLAGRDIQNITELEEALGHPLKENVFYDVDLKVYCFADGSVWKFSEKRDYYDSRRSFFSSSCFWKCRNYIGTKCC